MMFDLKKLRLELYRKIDEFLKERRETTGGWAPVEEKDLEQFREVIVALLEAKWERDPDGDLPVWVAWTDRTRYERPPYYAPIPYSHKVYELNGKKLTEEQLREHRLELASQNLSAVMEDFNTIVRMRKFKVKLED